MFHVIARSKATKQSPRCAFLLVLCIFGEKTSFVYEIALLTTFARNDEKDVIARSKATKQSPRCAFPLVLCIFGERTSFVYEIASLTTFRSQ